MRRRGIDREEAKQTYEQQKDKAYAQMDDATNKAEKAYNDIRNKVRRLVLISLEEYVDDDDHSLRNKLLK